MNPRTNHGRTVTETLPGGLTRITQTYLDGQLQSITGTAGVAEYHSYTVNSGSAAYEAGSITETVHYGTSDGAHWRKVTTNFLGQVLREEEPSPAGAGAVSVTTHEYNAKGQRVRTSRTGTADMIVEYDDWGRVAKQGYDVSDDGALTVNSNDVLSTSSTRTICQALCSHQHVANPCRSVFDLRFHAALKWRVEVGASVPYS